ncbi:MAG: FprA family A-type flavoprotein [Bacteroides sp.]|nr:FprA family A-type flavoprotein [Bacteroides sp.]
MYIRKITEHIAYVGVNDRSTTRFEGLWPLPYGVSYNAYLVRGTEKTALIDTVEIGHSREFLNTLKENGVDNLDYLIINHMEPDHSGSIPAVAAAFPDMKIVGNKKTIEMVKGFHHFDNDDIFLEIADLQEISLGDCSLRFYMTPMVHWPETMMTYCPEDKLIFSGDAFGCFGALNGGLTDDEMDCSLYLNEMYRYYSNIVGKYGQFVLKALARIEGVDLEYICSTHGPVWHSRVQEVLDITRRLASYEGEEGVTIIYGSMYGNTAEVAELFAREINKLGVRKICIHNAVNSTISQMISDAFRYKGLVIGSPTYNTEIFPPVAAVVSALAGRGIKNKVVASFGGFSWASAAAKKINDSFDALKLENAGSVNMKHSITPEVEEQVKELAKNFVELLNK